MAQKRMDEIAEELAGNPKSKGKKIIELRKLCGQHRTVPTSYKLEGVVKEGDHAQHITLVTEIWKGRYNNEVVALKILRVPRDDPQIQRTKSRFCKEVVLMKQLEHNNILPFYGVSTTDFCLVFPWYENGNIMDYLKKNPDSNRLDLLSGVASGLRYIHDNRLVHGDLKPKHILIDPNGTARLATAGRSSIVAVPNTSVAGNVQSALDEAGESRYSAPEIQWPEDYGMDEVLITKESDVYGIGMVAYEVLTGNIPYAGYGATAVMPKIQAGEMPQRSFEIADMVWKFLEECWSRDPKKRPSVARVCDTFSQSPSLPRVASTPGGRSAVEELPGKLKLQVQSIKISLNKTKQQHFSVEFEYGKEHHMTAPTMELAAGDEHTWNCPKGWLIETNKQHHGQLVTLKVHRRTRMGKDKICATGNFSLLNNVGEVIHVKLEAPRSTGPAVLKIFLAEAS